MGLFLSARINFLSHRRPKFYFPLCLLHAIQNKRTCNNLTHNRIAPHPRPIYMQSIPWTSLRQLPHLYCVWFYSRFPTGIITSSYSVEWRNQRSYCMYLLRSQGWGKKGMEQLIGEEREALLEQLASKQGQPVWPRDILNVSTFNIICSFIFGRRFEYDDKQLLRVIHLLNWLATFFGESAERDFVPLLQMSPSYIKLILSFKGMNDEIAGFIKSQIDERRKRMIEDPSDTPRDFIESYLMGLKVDISTTFTINQLLALKGRYHLGLVYLLNVLLGRSTTSPSHSIFCTFCFFTVSF